MRRTCIPEVRGTRTGDVLASPERIQSLDVVLTDQCNLRCGYCYQTDKNPRQMEWETLRSSLDLLLRSERDPIDVVFYGGEPLLEFPQIRRAVGYLGEQAGGKKVDYTISTNGLLVTDEVLEFLVAHDFNTQLSFDGVPEAQAVRGAQTFVKLDQLLDRIREAHPVFFRENFKVAVTLTCPTIPHLADSIEYFIGKGLQTIEINPVFTHYAAWEPEYYEQLDAQFDRISRVCMNHYARTGEVPVNLFRKDRELEPSSRIGRTMCGVPRGESLSVDVDGQVHGCVTLADSYQKYRTGFLQEKAEAMKLGDHRDPGFSDRLKVFDETSRSTGIFHGKQNKYSMYGKCGDCRYLDVCMVCPVSIGHIPGNTDVNRVPDFSCAFQLISMDHRGKFPVQPGASALLREDAAMPEMMVELMQFAGQRSG